AGHPRSATADGPRRTPRHHPRGPQRARRPTRTGDRRQRTDHAPPGRPRAGLAGRAALTEPIQRKKNQMSITPPDLPETILYEVKEHIATVTLNNPERYNAVSPAMRTGIRTA